MLSNVVGGMYRGLCQRRFTMTVICAVNTLLPSIASERVSRYKLELGGVVEPACVGTEQ
jgi:hypothetical protein